MLVARLIQYSITLLFFYQRVRLSDGPCTPVAGDAVAKLRSGIQIRDMLVSEPICTVDWKKSKNETVCV